MYENAPVPEDPWRYLRRTDLRQLRAAARRLARHTWAERLPRLDEVIAEAERRGVEFLRAESCLAGLGDRAFALHALVTARRVALFWLSPILLPWFRDDVTGAGDPPAWTVAWLAHPDHAADTLDRAGRILLAALRRDRSRAAALRPLVRALLLHRSAPRVRLLTAFVGLALEPDGADRGHFVSKWPKRWRQRARADAYTAELGTDDRALRRVVRVVMATAPRMLVDNPTLTRAFDALAEAERRAFLASEAVRDDRVLAPWVAVACEALARDREAAPANAVPTDGTRDVAGGADTTATPSSQSVVRDAWCDFYLSDAATRVAPRPIALDEAFPISAAWIRAVKATADRLAPWWPYALPGLIEAETALVVSGAPSLTVAHLAQLVADRPGERRGVAPGSWRPHRRDGAWRLGLLWRLALATPEIDVEWLQTRLRRELPAAIRAPRRPGWLQAWVEDPRTNVVDLLSALAMIEAVVGADPARLTATRLVHVARAILLHPNLPGLSTATPLLEALLDPRVQAHPLATREFARRFAARWGTAQLPGSTGLRLIRLFVETAPALLPAMPALDMAIPWMPPTEWATHACWLYLQAPHEARVWAWERARGLTEEDRAVGMMRAAERVTALHDTGGPAWEGVQAGVMAAAERPVGPSPAPQLFTLAPAYVPDREAGVARLVVHGYVDATNLTVLLSQLLRAARGGDFAYREGPVGGLPWTAATRRALRGTALDDHTADAAAPDATPYVPIVGCVDCAAGPACPGGVEAQVVVCGDEVRWGALRAVHDPAVRLHKLGTFHFARAAYLEALDAMERWGALLPETVPLASATGGA